MWGWPLVRLTARPSCHICRCPGGWGIPLAWFPLRLDYVCRRCFNSARLAPGVGMLGRSFGAGPEHSPGSRGVIEWGDCAEECADGAGSASR